MKVKIFFIFLLVLSVIGFASAINTTINIQTYASHTIFVTPLKTTGEYQVISQPVSGFTSVYGEKQVILDVNEIFHIYVLVKKGENTVYFKKFNEQTYEAGGIYNLTVLPSGVNPPKKPEIIEIASLPEDESNETINETNSTNQTDNKTTESENITTEKQEKITGFAAKEIKLTGKTLLYTGGTIVILIILSFLSRYLIKFKKKKPKEIKIKKLSEVHEEKKNQVEDQIKKIEEAKKMIQDAEHEIKRIRNPNYDRIEAAKRKLIEDQKELMRLRNEAKETGKALNELKRAEPSPASNQPQTQPKQFENKGE